MTLVGTNPKYEDTMQCFFFSTKELSEDEWKNLCDSINGIIASISKDYIWHRDEFRVSLPILTDQSNEIPCHLFSTTCFGDNIEDEWFIVYLILEITKIYNHMTIQIEDNDGDFLLIEAADYLPVWANPETTENRVFIFNQHLHIIPNTVVPTDSSLKLIEAIRLVSQNPVLTRSSPEIELAIMKRIGEYPQKIIESGHKAILKLPVEIATVLTLKPSLIAPIVSTYCNLDVLDAKHCKDIKLEDCIDTEVKFTKYLYAMLMQSELPKYIRHKNTVKEKKSQLGLKVTCAYRIIMSRLSEDIYHTSEYKKFLNSLTRNGYFKDNLEGSLEYSQLLQKAMAYFLDMECSISLNACNAINKLKSSDEFNKTTALLKQKSDTEMLEEDDDDWLNVSPDELNDFLNRHYGKNVKLKNKDPLTPHILTSELTDFLKETSNFDGIEHNRKENTENSIDFNSDDFVDCIEKLLNIVSNQSITNSDYSSDDDDDGDNSVENNMGLSCRAQDAELASKLKSMENGDIDINVFKNLSQSMKEQGVSGPASTILREIGVKKSDILDSDDDDC
ncbi:LOW QUALITY PROTEIN: protein ecdysoneless homolog [Maniola hyperantus]|uniref:LOW QUALITY PROTEIN: protein ecdysoneless homolog n=1 Tax=Aphantopus hyperantus TaxID=2795564 RepID=UPI00374846C0